MKIYPVTFNLIIRSMAVYVKYFSGLCLCFILMSGCRNNTVEQQKAKKILQDLLDQGDYFKLDTRTKQYQQSLDDESKLYFKAFLNNAFNRNTECIREVDS